MSNTQNPRMPRADAAPIPQARRRGLSTGVLGALAVLAAAGGAQPALAQFSSREGFSSAGAPEFRFEIEPYLWLPAIHGKVGLGRAPGFDPAPINAPRPTVAELVDKLNFAISCNCLVRYGNWSAEMNLLSFGFSQSKTLPAILPGNPGLRLHDHTSMLLVSPGVGYRFLNADDGKLSMDVRAGFSYDEVKASAEFEGSRLPGAARTLSFLQPWIGERLDYYPSPKWRLENTLAITGLGVDGGDVGWNGRVGASYLVTHWWDVSVGYAVSQTYRNKPAGSSGEDNTLDMYGYGPYLATGFRF
jgi:hypothetical protein